MRIGVGEGNGTDPNWKYRCVLEEDVEHHQPGIIDVQFVQQLRVELAVPRAGARLAQDFMGIIIHQDEHDRIGGGPGAEAVERIVAGVDPRIAERGSEQQTAKRRQRRAHERRLRENLLDDGSVFHKLPACQNQAKSWPPVRPGNASSQTLNLYWGEA